MTFFAKIRGNFSSGSLQEPLTQLRTERQNAEAHGVASKRKKEWGKRAVE
jgi:hypothetical protein